MNKRILGIIGALLGGFIFTIPWILVYVFGNMLFSILAAFIAYGALLGYKKLGGIVDKKTPIIIVISSVLVIIVTTLVIIPLCLLYREGYLVNLHNLEIVYSISDFKSAIVHDLIVSVFFTFIGISGVVSKLKMEVDPNVNLKQVDYQKSINDVKQAFIKYHAVDKFNATSKDNILREINNDENLFKRLQLQQIIKKSNGNYYFCEKAEKSVLYRFSVVYLKVFGIIVIICLFVVLLLLLFD